MAGFDRLSALKEKWAFVAVFKGAPSAFCQCRFACPISSGCLPSHSFLLMGDCVFVGSCDDSWTNTFMGNDGVPFEIELTWNRGRVEPYENGGKDTHIAFVVDDFDAAHELHEKMGCIIRENPRMSLYFIADPEGRWIEILPAR